jgi:hypothetical protein
MLYQAIKEMHSASTVFAKVQAYYSLTHEGHTTSVGTLLKFVVSKPTTEVYNNARATARKQITLTILVLDRDVRFDLSINASLVRISKACYKSL